MKNVFMITFVILIVIDVSALFAKKDMENFDNKSINADSLWNRITKEDDYHKYSFWPDHKGMQPGRAPHGPFHKIFINDIIREAIPMTNKTVPEGGIIVKEAYDSDQEMNNISVMVKIKDFNPAGNDWYWAQYSPNGKILSSGKVGSCINCHKAFINNDFVIMHKLEKNA